MIESPVLQELIAETTAEATQKAILGVLKTRFGPLPPEVGSALKTISDERRLEQLVEQAVLTPDLDTFRRQLGP